MGRRHPNEWTQFLAQRDPDPPCDPDIVMLGCQPDLDPTVKTLDPQCPVCHGAIPDAGVYCGACDRSDDEVEAVLKVALRRTKRLPRITTPASKPAEPKLTRKERRRAGLPEPSTNGHLVKRKPSDIPEIRAMADAGQSYQKIADHFHVSRGTVGDVINGRTWTGDPAVKLTPVDIPLVLEMRAAGKSYRKIAQRFGVAKATIVDVVQGRTWIGIAATARGSAEDDKAPQPGIDEVPELVT